MLVAFLCGLAIGLLTGLLIGFVAAVLLIIPETNFPAT
jgi:hypothetical protein